VRATVCEHSMAWHGEIWLPSCDGLLISKKIKKNSSDVTQLNRWISLSCLPSINLAEGIVCLCNLLSLYAVQADKGKQRPSITLWFYTVLRLEMMGINVLHPLLQSALYSVQNSFLSVRDGVRPAGVSLPVIISTAEQNKLRNLMPLLFRSEPHILIYLFIYWFYNDAFSS
jgi:hypothetical protein